MEEPNTGSTDSVFSEAATESARLAEGAEAAFKRVAEKILERERAAGLEPVARSIYESGD